MNTLAWLFKLVLKGAIFFTLFAFALNNQGDVTVHFFFGYRWTTPVVLLVLAAFSAGLMLGVLGMVPRWWRHRRAAARARIALNEQAKAAPTSRAAPLATPHGL